jgi:hypothetical protein
MSSVRDARERTQFEQRFMEAGRSPSFLFGC